MSAIYPELKQHLLETQRSFEEYVQSLSMDTPPQVKESLMRAIKSVQQEGKKVTATTSEAKIVQLPAANTTSSNWKWLAAASVLLLLGLGSLYLLEAGNSTNLREQVTALNKEKKAEQDKMQLVQAKLTEKENAQQLMFDPATVTVQLAGTPLSADAQVKVYYNAQKGKALLTTPRLPAPEKDKQYQLWALVDGKPIDLGVFDHDSTSGFGSLLPVDLSGIQAFAITLEKKGGSPTPNLEQLYVIGNI